MAARAEKMLNGRWPADKIMGRGDRDAFRVLFEKPFELDDATLARLAPELAKCNRQQLNGYPYALPPAQALAVGKPEDECYETVRQQLKSLQTGEGEKAAITVKRPAEPAVKPPRQGGEF